MRFPTQTTNRARGFTLIEAMTATVVLAACVAALCTVLVTTAQNNDAVDEQVSAMEAARRNVESLSSRSLTDLSAGASSNTQSTISSSYLDTTGQTPTGTLRFLQRQGTQDPHDLAVITITTTTPDGQVVTLRRLVTTAEVSQ